MREISGYLGGAQGELYVTWHPPVGRARGAALVLAPYGEERKCAYRLLFDLTQRLAAAGWGTMRFDYAGTGESLGELSSVTLADWLDDARVALAAVREEMPGMPVMLVGARLGGLLAAQLADEPEVAGLALLEPVLAGDELVEELLRRKQVKEMMGAGKASSEAGSAEASWRAGGSVDFDGFSMGAAFAEQLRAMELLPTLTSVAALPLLVVHVSGARKLSGRWSALGEHCEAAVHRKLCIVREKPFWGRTDHHTSEETVGEVLAFGERVQMG